MALARLLSYSWKISLVVLLFAIGAGALFWLSQSPVLAVDAIIIDGNHAVATDQIMEKVAPLLRGQSMVHPPFDTVRGELGDFPFIESVEFERDFPNTVVIHVRENRPFLCLQAAGGKNFILSSEGKVLMEQNGACPALPVLATKEPCPAEVGKPSDCRDVLTGAQFLINIPVSFNYEFSEVLIDAGDIRARTKNGVNVHFGSLDDYGLKFEVLRQMLARSVVAGAQMTIDVSVPQRPVTKEEKPPESGSPATGQQ